jgi:hypothetical protein
MANVDFDNMLVCDYIIRQQQLVAQGIAEGDMLMGDVIIRMRLQELRAECEIDETVLRNLPVSLFLSHKFDTGDLPMILFRPWLKEHQLRESDLPNFNQIQQEEETFHEDVIVSLPEVLNMDVDVEKTSIKEEKPEKIEKLITTGEKERATFEEEEILDFIVCSKVDFVIKPYEEIEVYIVEFEMGNEEKSYYMEKSNAKIWRKNATWNKVILSKISRTSKAIFKVP